MRIALIGEFSGVHAHLKRGLEALGHSATVFSSGDGFKQIAIDRPLGPAGHSRVDLARFLLVTQPRQLRAIMNEFDVVQLMNPTSLSSPSAGRSLYARALVRLLEGTTARKALVVAGCDARVQAIMPAVVPGLCASCLQDAAAGVQTCTFALHTSGNRTLTEEVADLCDVVIPFGFRPYAEAHRGLHRNVAPTQTFPLFLADIPFAENDRAGHLRVLHGISRPGSKGTPVILPRLQRMANEGTIDLAVPERLPYVEYLTHLQQTNVVVDQLYSGGLAINALTSMALGRIVVTSLDHTYVDGFVDYRGAPAVDLGSSADTLQAVIERLCRLSPAEVREQGRAARAYVERTCRADLVAARLLDAWSP